MSKKTDAFLNDLVNLCVSHGVRLRASDGVFRFEGNGVKPTPVSDVSKTLGYAFSELRDESMFLIFRDNAGLGRRWLYGEKQWRVDRAKAGLKIISLPEAKRLIRTFKKLPATRSYTYGVESIYGRDRIIVG